MQREDHALTMTGLARPVNSPARPSWSAVFLAALASVGHARTRSPTATLNVSARLPSHPPAAPRA